MKKDFDFLSDVASVAYLDYPMHNWFTNDKIS
jgi:hypothetical protein